MTGSTYIKQAIIAALCEHPDQEKYRARAFAGDSLAAMADALAGKSVALTKRDFFTPTEDGTYLIDTPGFWKNFSRVRDLLAQGNEHLTSNDFLFLLKTAPAPRTLLQSATEHNGLGAVFSEKVWNGRYDEMERLWYKVPVPARRALTSADGSIPFDLRRTLLLAEGRAVPEDRLARAGVTTADIHAAFRERGDYEGVVRRLAVAGDRLRKEYLLLADHIGDTCFASQNAWTRYPEIARALAAQGEPLEIVDFIRQLGSTNNILARAMEHRALDKVFAPELWVGRLSDMLGLWGHVFPAWKVSPLTAADFDKAYAEAESRTYESVIDFTAIHGKQDLLQPLNAGEVKAVIPLGLKSFWAEAAAILPALAKQGEPVLLKDLRRQSGQLGNSCLISAAKFGAFRHVVDLAKTNGEPILLDDFLSRDSHDNTLLSILAERKELSLVFAPELWAGRLGDMRALWAQVRHADRGQVDIANVEIAAAQATLRMKSRPGLKIKPR